MFSTFATPNPVLYGVGSSSRTGEKLREFGCKRVFVVYDKGIKAAGVVDKVLGYIQDAGIEAVCYDGVIADVPDYSVEQAAEAARAGNVDGVVAIGGGSTLDTAKGVRILLSNPSPINRYFTRPGMTPPGDFTALVPLIVLPTTAGTGSEVSPGGVIIDTKNNFKEHIICPVSLGIVDPELTLGLPPAVTAMTAFDALGHAIEAVTSREPNVFSDLIGLRAIELIATNLPRVMKDGSNLDARAGLHLAATMATMSILGPYCNVPHDMGLILGMNHDMPHGIAVSVALPECLEFIAPAIPETMARVAKALGADVPDGASPEDIGRLAAQAARGLMRAAKLPSIKSFAKSKEDFLASIPEIMRTQNFHFSPRPVTEADVRDILSRAYDAAE